MSVVVVRYVNEATEQSFILAEAADEHVNTLHRAFEQYLAGGWTTEILSYYPSFYPSELSDCEDWLGLERREERAHGEYQWD